MKDMRERERRERQRLRANMMTGNDADYKVRRYERMQGQMRGGEVGVGNTLEQQEVSW